MRGTKVELVLDHLPPVELSPNARGFWARRYEANEELKNEVIILAKNAKLPRFKKVKIDYTFVVPNNKRRDVENYLFRTKSIPDSLVLAGVLSDDKFKVVKQISGRIVVMPGEEKTIIRITGEVEP